MVPQSGVWFRHGLLHLTSYAFYAVPPSTSDESGGCVSAGDIALCGFDSPVQMPDYTHLMYVHQEWVPVPDVLEPGEALFFANARNVGGGTWVTASEADWALWRLTRLGGAHRWLDRAAFEALMDTAGKSAVANEPLGPVVSIGVRDDARRVCLVGSPQKTEKIVR